MSASSGILQTDLLYFIKIFQCCSGHLLFEQPGLAPDEFVAAPEDCCRPEALVLVPVQVEDNLPPPAPLALQQRPLHAEAVHSGGDPVLQPSQVQEGGELVSDVNQAEGERRFNI